MRSGTRYGRVDLSSAVEVRQRLDAQLTENDQVMKVGN